VRVDGEARPRGLGHAGKMARCRALGGQVPAKLAGTSKAFLILLL